MATPEAIRSSGVTPEVALHLVYDQHLRAAFDTVVILTRNKSDGCWTTFASHPCPPEQWAYAASLLNHYVEKLHRGEVAEPANINTPINPPKAPA